MAARNQEQWLTRERVLVIVLVAASVLVGWLCWMVVHPFVPALTWAVVLAVIAHPLHERLSARMPRWPNAAAGLAVACVTIVIAVPSAIVVREGQRCKLARLATAGAGPVPVRLRAAEEILEREGLGEAALDAAARKATELVSPDADIHASADYRRHLAGVLTKRALMRAIGVARG